MEKLYKKIIFDISNLIKQKKYQRAINLGKWTIQKGIKTNQLIIIISYSIKNHQSIQQAIKFIKNHIEQQKQSDNKEGYMNNLSPLFSFVLAQYYTQLENIEQAYNMIELLLIGDQKQVQKQSLHQLDFKDKSLGHSLCFLMQNYSANIKQRPLKLKQNIFQKQKYDSIIVGLIQQVNQITQSFLKVKQLTVNNQQFNKKINKENTKIDPQIILKYGSIYLLYEQVKNKILAQLSIELKRPQKVNLFKRCESKNQKQLGKLNMSSQKKLINFRSKQLFYRDNNNQRKILKSNDKNSKSKQNILMRHTEIKDANFQINDKHQNIENLKIVLKKVCKFIKFTKEKINQYEHVKIM